MIVAFRPDDAYSPRMADRKPDSAKQALDILRSAPFSSVVNAFVLPLDTFYQLVGILEGDGAADESTADEPDAEPEAKPTSRKDASQKKRK
jgi:hypothetical protein